MPGEDWLAASVAGRRWPGLRLAWLMLVTRLAAGSCCELPPFDPDGGWG